MEVPQGDTYYILFTTRQFSTGAPFTLTAATVSVYEEGTATPIQTLVAVTENYNTVTGLNMVPIVATSGNGYDIGSYYSVVIDAGTVDSVSAVGEVVGHFRVMPPEDASAGIKDVNVTHVGDAAEDIATTTELDKVPKSDGTVTWNATAAATIQTEANDALVANHLDHLLAVAYNSASPEGVTDSLLNEMTENNAGTTRFTAASLAQGPGGTPSQPLLASSTILAYTSNTQFTIQSADGSDDDDAYNGQLCVITDQATGKQKAVGLIVDYTGASQTIFLDADPGVFTYANNDVVEIWAVSGSAVPLEIDTNGRVDVGSVAGTVQAAGDIVTLVNAVQTTATNVETDLSNGVDGLGALSADIGTAQADLDIITGATGVNLLAATQTSIDNIETDTSTTLDGKINTISTNVDTVNTDLSNATDGLGAIKTDTAAVKIATDKLTFTVANQVDANIQSVDDAAISEGGSAPASPYGQT